MALPRKEQPAEEGRLIGGGPVVRALQGEETVMADSGLLKGRVNDETWIDRSFYHAAVKRLDARN
jgi:hypothetical protein